VHADYGGRIELDRCILGSVMSGGDEEGVSAWRLATGLLLKAPRAPYVLCYGRDRDGKGYEVRLRSIQNFRSPEESGHMPYRISGDKYDPLPTGCQSSSAEY
jgi:hypothetical protein